MSSLRGMTIRRMPSALALAAATFALSLVFAPGVRADENLNVVENAQAEEQLSSLVEAIEAAGLADDLSAEGPFTVLAPTNDAFAALGEGRLEELKNEPETLAAILQYHVIPGSYSIEELKQEDMLATLQGQSVDVNVDEDDNTTVNGVRFAAVDVAASNGTVHVIDEVLAPSADNGEVAAATDSLPNTGPADVAMSAVLSLIGAVVLVAGYNVAKDYSSAARLS